MSKEGLSFANPYIAGANVGVPANPYEQFNPASKVGTDGLAPSLADMAVQGEALVKANQFTMPQLKQPPAIAFSPSKNQLFVNGISFAADDAATALQSESLLTHPSPGLPQGGDWVPLDEQSYGQYLETIRNPSLGRLMKKNFGIGVDNMQMLGGRGLQFLGAEETGQAIVDQQMKDLAKTTPFLRDTSSVHDANTAIDWLAATVAQQGPNILESIGVAAAGFVGGTLAGGPVAGAGAAIAGLAGKTAFKQAVLAALKKRAAGEALDKVETKLLREAAGITGATIATTAANYGMGVSDIYGEQRDQGQEGDRLSALAGAVPYTALESLSEFVLASRLFGRGGLSHAGGTALKDIQGKTMLGTAGKRGVELLKRGTKGAVVGGTLEGTTEVGQEALVLGLSDQDLTTPEAQDRMFEAFAAGFGVGGTIGGVANLKRGPIVGQSADLLNPAATPEPQAEPGTALTTVPTQAGEPVGPTTVTGFGERPQGGTTNDRIYTGELPPGLLGEQGVLDIFGAEGATVGELRGRSRVPEVPLGLPAPAPEAAPGQGVLQFAPAAPEPTATQPNAIQLAMQRAQTQQQLESRAAQEQAAKDAEMNRLAIAAQNQRQLDFAAQAERAQAPAPVEYPMLPARERVPQQMSLFKRGELPKVSRRERLRRGVNPLLRDLEEAMPPTPVDLRKQTQVPMFTQKGEPTITAERAAGKKQAAIPKIEVGATQLPPTGKKFTPADLAKAKAESVKAEEARKAKVKQSVEKLKAKEKAVPRVVRVRRVTGANVSPEKVRDVGFHFGTEAQVADIKKSLPNAREVEVDIDASKLLRLNEPEHGGWANPVSVLATLDANDIPVSKAVRNFVNGLAISDKPIMRGKEISQAQRAALDALAKAVEDKGYTGIVYENKYEGNKSEDSYILFNLPEGMKDVTKPTEPTPPKGGKLKVEAKRATTEAKGTTEKAQALRKGPSGLTGLVKQMMAEPVVEVKAKKDTTTSDATQLKNEAIRKAIEDAETTTNKRVYTDAIYDIVEEFATESNKEMLSLKLVDEFISNGGISKAEFKAMLKEVALTRDSIRANSRIFNLLADNGLLNDPLIQASGILPRVKGMVDTRSDEDKTNDVPDYFENRLADLINNRDGRPNKVQLIKAAKELYAKVKNTAYVVGDRGAIEDFFTKDGAPIIAQLPGTSNYVLASEEEQRLSVDEYTAQHNSARAILKALEAEETQTTLDDIVGDPLYDNFAARDGDVLEYYRADNTPANPMQAGALKLFVSRVVSKYARKPNVAVFSNLADMKKSNPALFKTAAKARKAGDIEHVNAAGMAWGNNVVLFADNIRSEQHARFIIAHETLGHVGFRGLFSDKALNQILQIVADSDVQVRNAAEAYSESMNVPFLEAVEEVLSNHAAAVDGNTILRFWNWVKDKLNAMGLKFGDDAARYLIGLSRKYIREGTGRSEINVTGLLREVDKALLSEGSNVEVLRFAASAPQGTVTFAMNQINRSDAINNGLSGAIDHIIQAKDKALEASKHGKGAKKNIVNVIQKVLDGLETQDNLGRKSKGGYAIFGLLQSKAARQAEYKTRYAVGTKTAHEAKLLGYGEGPTPEESVRAGELLAYATLLRMNQHTDADLNKMDNVAFFDTVLDEIKPNHPAFEALKDAGRISLDEFRKGFKVQQGYTTVPMTEEHRIEITKERDGQIADLEAAQARALARVEARLEKAEKAKDKLKLQLEAEEISDKYAQDIENTKRLYNKRAKETVYDIPNMVDTPASFRDLTADSIEFKIYNEFFDTLADSHVDVLFSKYKSARHEQRRAISAGVAEAFNKSLTPQEQKFIDDVIDQYDSMRMEDSVYKGNRLEKSAQAEKEADDFLNYRFSRSFYSDGALNDFAPTVKGYAPEQVKSLVSGLRVKLTSKIDPNVDPITDSSIWKLKNRIEERNMFVDSINDDQLYAKRSIAGSYTPLTRKGEWQVRVRAYIMNNDEKEYIKLYGAQQDSLAFFKTDKEATAERYQEELNTLLGGEFDMRDDKGAIQKVKLEAVRSVAAQTPDLVDVLHYDEVMYSLSKLGLVLKPEQRDTLVKKISSQNSRARSNLQRAGTPGWDKDVVRGASAFLEQQAYVAANKEFRHQFDEVLDDNRNWFGDPEKLAAAKKLWESSTGEAKRIAGIDYAREKFWMDNAVKVKDGKEAGWGNYYKERAKSLLDWMDSTGDIVHADDIWSQTEWGIAARTMAAVGQLGGSIATGITQMLSLPTNSWAYLAATNPKNGFGLGLGAGKAGKLLAQMAMNLGHVNYGSLEFINKELAAMQKSGASVNKDGITFDELDFLQMMTEEQRLDAAQFNALTGTSRGRKLSSRPIIQKGIEVWMFPFRYSEQFNRRVTLLAAYRGEYERNIAAGKSNRDAIVAARAAASEAVDKTQGDYSQYTRPAFFRGGIQSFVYMYKQYPILMLQLLKNMNYEGRVIMIGSLLLLSGMRGLPGSDDILDILDGLMQHLGMKSGSVEKEFARLTREYLGDELGGELSPIVMRGLLDHVTGWSFSNRMGLGDIVPGTGLLKPSMTDKEIVREIENIAGAPTSFMSGMLSTASNAVAVATGRRSASALFEDLPIRAVKNAADAWRYSNTGAILDSKGAVVADNITTWEILGKAMGWYPSRAQRQMDWMAADAQEAKYMSMVKTDFVREAVAARLEGDMDKLARVKENVDQWNEAASGTRLEIRNFSKAVSQSYMESKKPLAARYLKSSARGGRAEAKEILQFYGIDADTLYGTPN